MEFGDKQVARALGSGHLLRGVIALSSERRDTIEIAPEGKHPESRIRAPLARRMGRRRLALGNGRNRLLNGYSSASSRRDGMNRSGGCSLS
jgi:hypothetical protein